MTERNYDAQRTIPSLMTPLEFYDNKEFMKWLGTPECRVWHRMYRYVVRAEMKKRLNSKIYNDYYTKGILAMYQSQQEIADFLEIKSLSHISDVMKNMIEKGIIIPHKDKWDNRSITIYELGTHDMGPSRHENYHLFNYFTKLNAEIELKNRGL